MHGTVYCKVLLHLIESTARPSFNKSTADGDATVSLKYCCLYLVYLKVLLQSTAPFNQSTAISKVLVDFSKYCSTSQSTVQLFKVLLRVMRSKGKS